MSFSQSASQKAALAYAAPLAVIVSFIVSLLGETASAQRVTTRAPSTTGRGATATPRITTSRATTSPDITAADLRTRLFIFADDSMQGRRAGSLGHIRATDYIARELARLGLTPAGDRGTYFQRVRVRAGSSDSAWSRNVVAILRGSDRLLRAQYVALGAHSDHIGFRAAGAVDHDSVRAYDHAAWLARGRVAGAPELTRAQARAIRVDVPALRRVRAARRDSIYNGADDDGSGSMALLEIAERLASAATAPRRSVLFVWHTGEEIDLNGSTEFTAHPTVPLTAIVAQLNVDMIGRGSAADLARGGPNYLSVIGPRRLSSDLASIVAQVNATQSPPFAIDSTLDADGHPEAIYCRSDHWNYARRGIPIVFLFTNLHEDYHEVTDEAQYIEYTHYTRVTRFIDALLMRIADREAAPRVDHVVPPLGTPCRQ
jgi:hypothetical protein